MAAPSPCWRCRSDSRLTKVLAEILLQLGCRVPHAFVEGVGAGADHVAVQPQAAASLLPGPLLGAFQQRLPDAAPPMLFIDHQRRQSRLADPPAATKTPGRGSIPAARCHRRRQGPRVRGCRRWRQVFARSPRRLPDNPVLRKAGQCALHPQASQYRTLMPDTIALNRGRGAASGVAHGSHDPAPLRNRALQRFLLTRP